MSDVNLSISSDVVTPIVETKIKAAVLEALGGAEKIIEVALDKILNTKVNKDGKVDSYSSSNKYTWLDIVFTKQIQSLVENEVRNQIKDMASPIKDALIAKLRTKKGANSVAAAMLAGLEDTFDNNWTSKIDISFSPPKVRY